MPLREGESESPPSSSIATVCQDCDTAGVSPRRNRLCVVRSRLVRGGLAEARAAGAQHKEYMSVRVALANEATSLEHGVGAAVEEMGHAPSEAQLEALLAEFDFDRSGQG